MLGMIAGILMIILCFASENVFFEFYSPLAITGRIFHGLSVGVFMTFCLVTINEFSPDELKMTMVNIYQISIELGIFITHIVFLVFANCMFKKDDSSSSWKTINSIMFSFPLLILTV
jgi:MFS family permease